jgi:copper chaperone CopZ
VSTAFGATLSDGLTRTTLQIDGSTSDSAFASVIGALQRVPGVLLAEVNRSTACALVAHDGAVAATSLLAAVLVAGNHAKVVEPEGATSSEAVRTRRQTILSVVGLGSVIFVVLTLIDVLVPGSSSRRWLMPVLMSIFWFFFFAQSFLVRRS